MDTDTPAMTRNPELDPTNPDRPRGGLTERDRKYLIGALDVEDGSQHDRSIRRQIRERYFHALLDLSLVDLLADRDRGATFGAGDDRGGRFRGDWQVEHERRDARDEAFRSLAAVLYRYATDSDDLDDRTRAVASILEDAVGHVEAGGGTDDRVLTLDDPTVSLSISYPRTIDLDHLEATWEAQADAETWDWSAFTTDELLFSFFQVVDVGTQLTEFDRTLAAALQNRLADDWGFVDDVADLRDSSRSE